MVRWYYGKLVESWVGLTGNYIVATFLVLGVKFQCLSWVMRYIMYMTDGGTIKRWTYNGALIKILPMYTYSLFFILLHLYNYLTPNSETLHVLFLTWLSQSRVSKTDFSKAFAVIHEVVLTWIMELILWNGIALTLTVTFPGLPHFSG